MKVIPFLGELTVLVWCLIIYLMLVFNQLETQLLNILKQGKDLFCCAARC